MIDLCVVHFPTVSLPHLDAAWFSVCQQDLSLIRRVHFLDNNSPHTAEEVMSVVNRVADYRIVTPPLALHSEKHGDPTKTHSWSVNRLCRDLAPEADWILFTRSDYILSPQCARRFYDHAVRLAQQGKKPFVTSWCWQMACDAQASNTDVYVDIEQYRWRERGFEALFEHPYAVRFHETNRDAGVWLTRRRWMEEAGWMNEQLTAWGYQQSTFQRALSRKGVVCEAIPEYLFAHQHHYAPRDFGRAAQEYKQFGGGL